jgi:hypothetical protein
MACLLMQCTAVAGAEGSACVHLFGCRVALQVGAEWQHASAADVQQVQLLLSLTAPLD